MAVRFLPPPEERVPANRDEGENLAEVVEMRSWLRPAPAPAPVSEAWAEAEADAGADACAEAEAEVAQAEAEDETDAFSSVRAAEAVHAQTSAKAWSSDARVTRVRFGDVTGVGAADESDVQASSVPDVQARGDSPGEAADEPTRSEAYEDAVRLLARRARSSGELRDELLALDHSADEVSIVIDEFIDSHYLDDVGLARVQSEKLRDSKGASRGQIARKLRERKLPDAVVEEILGELDVDEEYSLLREAAAKRAERLTGLDRPTAQRRLLGFLARRGWSGEPAMRAVNEALDGGLGRRKRGPGGVRFE